MSNQKRGRIETGPLFKVSSERPEKQGDRFSQCIFDFETRNKQMFTEARAFSRVTYFFIFWGASWIFT